jgi:hypothetical protein
MSRQVTKAGANRYCQARLEAAKCNDRLASRASASEEIGCISEEALKKYELGVTRPPNDVVALMADTYNAPELVLWYCANECPLGKNCREVPEMPPERTFVRLTNTLNRLNASMHELAEIMDNGAEDEAERKKIPRLWDDFLEARRRIDETLAVLEKLQIKV